MRTKFVSGLREISPDRESFVFGTADPDPGPDIERIGGVAGELASAEMSASYVYKLVNKIKNKC